MTSIDHKKALPDDLLEFFDAVDGRTVWSAEELALSLIPDAPRRGSDDPALWEPRTRSETRVPASWFADEEPETPYQEIEDDEVEAVDELLVAQHYLFDDPSGDR